MKEETHFRQVIAVSVNGVTKSKNVIGIFETTFLDSGNKYTGYSTRATALYPGEFIKLNERYELPLVPAVRVNESGQPFTFEIIKTKPIDTVTKDNYQCIEVSLGMSASEITEQNYSKLIDRFKQYPKIYEILLDSKPYIISWASQKINQKAVDHILNVYNLGNKNIASTPERLEQQRLEQQKLEQQRLEQERLEQEKLEQQRLEQQRLEQQKLEQERLEQQKLEQQRLEQERLEQQKLEQEKLEQEKLEQEKLEQQRLEQQRLEQKRLEQLKHYPKILKTVTRGYLPGQYTILYFGESKEFIQDDKILKADFKYNIRTEIDGVASVFFETDSKEALDLKTKELILEVQNAIAAVSYEKETHTPYIDGDEQSDIEPVVYPAMDIWNSELGNKSLDSCALGDYIPVVAASSYTGDPILKGVLKVVPGRENQDEFSEDNDLQTQDSEDDDEKGSGMYSTELLTTDYIISENPGLLDNMLCQYKYVANTRTSEYCFDYETSPDIEIVLLKSQSAIVFKKKAEDIVEQDLVDFALSTKNFESLNIISTLNRCLHQLEYKVAIDTRALFIPEDVKELFTGKALNTINNYLEEQRLVYGELNTRHYSLEGNEIGTDMLVCNPADKLFIPIDPICNANFSSIYLDTFQLPNLSEIFKGIQTTVPYNNSIYWRTNLEVLREHYAELGKSKSEIDTLIQEYADNIIGVYDAPQDDILDNEKEYFKYLVNQYNAALILQNNLKTADQLTELLNDNTECPVFNKRLKMLCSEAYFLNRGHLNQYADETILKALGYNMDSTDGLNYNSFKLELTGEQDVRRIKKVRVPVDVTEYTTNNISGTMHYEYFINTNIISAYKWIYTFIKLCRWGTNKSLFLKFSPNLQKNQDIVYDFESSSTVLAYNKMNMPKLKNIPYTVNRGLKASVSVQGIQSKKINYPMVEKVFTDLLKYDEVRKIRKTMGTLLDNDDNVVESFIIHNYLTLTRSDSAYENVQKRSVSYLDAVHATLENDGYLLDSNGDKLHIPGVEYNKDLERVSITHQSSTSANADNPFICLNDTSLRTAEQRISYSKNALTEVITASVGKISTVTTKNTDQIVYQESCTLVSKGLNEIALKYANEFGLQLTEYQLLQYNSYNLFNTFINVSNILQTSKENKLRNKLYLTHAVPYIIANILIQEYEDRFGGRYAEISQLEVILNCYLYAINIIFYDRSATVDSFLESIHVADSKIAWINDTKVFAADGYVKVKDMNNQLIPQTELGGIKQSTSYFNKDIGETQEDINAYQQAFCYPGKIVKVAAYKEENSILELRIITHLLGKGKHGMFISLNKEIPLGKFINSITPLSKQNFIKNAITPGIKIYYSSKIVRELVEKIMKV